MSVQTRRETHPPITKNYAKSIYLLISRVLCDAPRLFGGEFKSVRYDRDVYAYFYSLKMRNLVDVDAVSMAKERVLF